MHRRARLVPVLALAAGAVLLPSGVAHSAQAAKPKPITQDAADSRTEQRTVRNYWTSAKMAAARPFDLPARGASGRSFNSTASRGAEGRPVTIPPSRAVAAGAAAGSAWTRGGAVARTTGRVFFTHQGRNSSCSGNAVSSANKSVVITAGHCVKMGGDFHRNWVFVPGYRNGDRPFGTWVATALLTTTQWNEAEDVNHDMAAAVVAPLEGRRLVDVVGGQGVAFNQARRLRMHSFGFPAGSPYDGSRLIYCSGRAFDDFLMSRGIGLTCDMTGGSSGGPWFAGFDESTGLGTQNSVNSFKYNFAPNWMFGPYFGQEAKAVYEAAQRQGAA